MTWSIWYYTWHRSLHLRGLMSPNLNYLNHLLWLGIYWLSFRQQVHCRREMIVLHFNFSWCDFLKWWIWLSISIFDYWRDSIFFWVFFWNAHIVNSEYIGLLTKTTVWRPISYQSAVTTRPVKNPKRCWLVRKIKHSLDALYIHSLDVLTSVSFLMYI